MTRLQDSINKFKSEEGEEDSEEKVHDFRYYYEYYICIIYVVTGESPFPDVYWCLFQERMDRIDKQYEADKTKLQSIRLLLVRVC